MDRIRVALIGAGNMANTVHYPSLVEFGDVEIVGLCDLVPEKLQKTAERFGIKRIFSDYRQMIEETAPEAIYVLMPPYHLFDVVLHCLSQDLHVFIEKPPGVTAEQARQMAHAANRAGKVMMVGFQRRFIPVIVEARRQVEDRGPIHQCVATFYKNHVGKGPYYNGAMDILTCDAIHAVDELRWMAGGEAVSVASHVKSLDAAFDNIFLALIEFSTGVSGVLLANWMCGRRFFTVEMHAPGISAFADPDAEGWVYADDKPEGARLDPSEIAGSDEFYKKQGFYRENRHFIDCVKSGSEPLTSIADGVKTMELVERIYMSRVSGSRVTSR